MKQRARTGYASTHTLHGRRHATLTQSQVNAVGIKKAMDLREADRIKAMSYGTKYESRFKQSEARVERVSRIIARVKKLQENLS